MNLDAAVQTIASQASLINLLIGAIVALAGGITTLFWHYTKYRDRADKEKERLNKLINTQMAELNQAFNSKVEEFYVERGKNLQLLAELTTTLQAAYAEEEEEDDS